MSNNEVVNEPAAKLMDREWSIVQKKTFTKWVNSKLSQIGAKVEDVKQDLTDGVQLLNLLSIIGNETLKFNKTPKMRIQKVENLNKALEFIKSRGVPITNIGAEDILDGNEKLILGLLWVVILRFSIAEISEGELSAKEGLLLWCQRKTQGYAHVSVKDFTNSWSDGLALCALIHKHRPDLIDFDSLDKSNKSKNVELAFNVAATKLNIAKLLDVEDLASSIKPDERSVMTYVAQYFHAFSNMGKFETATRRIQKFASVVEAAFEMQNDYQLRAEKFISQVDQVLTNWATSQFDGSYLNAKNQSNDLVAFKNKEKRQLVTEKRNLDTLLGDINTKLKTFDLKPYSPPANLAFEDIERKWQQLSSSEIQRRKQINQKLFEIKEKLRLQFAEPANKFHNEIEQISVQLANLSGELESQLNLTKNLSLNLNSIAKKIDEIQEIDKKLIEANIEENDYTVYAVDDLVFDYQLIQQSLARKIVFIENQIVARSLTNVTPQQLEEFESTFHHFDKDNSNDLTALEFKAACSALGIPIEDSEFDKIFSQVATENEKVKFQNFVDYCKNLTEDKTSIGQLKEAFSVISSNKGFATEQDLKLIGDAHSNFFKMHINDNKFDFTGFIDSIFSQ